MAEEFRVLRPYEFHSQLIKKKTRADGRKLEEFREIKLETDAIKTANSSSLVKLGNTSLVCGCTIQLIKTKDTSQQDDNDINLKVELPPICSSPTGHQTQHSAQLLTKALKNILDDTNCLDKQCLQVHDQECFWSVDIEVICLNYDGCLLDAALIAVLAALKTLKLKDDSNHVPEKDFVVKSMPVCSSFALIGDYYICDPNLEEETVAQSTFTISVDPSVTTGKYHINKIGGKSIDLKRLARCISLAKMRASEIAKYLDSSLSKGDIANMDCT